MVKKELCRSMNLTLPLVAGGGYAHTCFRYRSVARQQQQGSHTGNRGKMSMSKLKMSKLFKFYLFHP